MVHSSILLTSNVSINIYVPPCQDIPIFVKFFHCTHADCVKETMQIKNANSKDYSSDEDMFGKLYSQDFEGSMSKGETSLQTSRLNYIVATEVLCQ